MTFSTNVPNANQSPGLFPAQNNTNFNRLQAIINQEHNFLNTQPTPPDSQGIHKQCTMINRATPTAPIPAGNGILYSQNDANGNSQLFWFTNNSNTQITPGVMIIAGSASLISTQTQTIFADPGYSYQAYYWNSLTGVNRAANRLDQGVLVHWTNGQNFIYPSFTTSTSSFSFAGISGNDLILTNNLPSTQSYSWVLMVNQII